MYIVREIFHLQFGRYKEAKALMDEGIQKGILPKSEGSRILTDFTGGSYRLIFELPFAALGDFENDLKRDMSGVDWQGWYEKFKPLIRHSEREILKVVG